MDVAIITLLAGTLLIVSLILALIWYILQVISYWKIFEKAGEPGWKSLIPIYNSYVEYRLVWDTRVFWAVFFCGAGTLICSIIGGDTMEHLGDAFQLAIMVFGILESNKLSKAFGHGIGFTIGLIVLNPIFKLILSLGSSEYRGPQ